MINFDDINKFRNYLKESVNKCIGDEFGEFVMDKTNIFTTFISVHNGGER
jgi:hypothetical protein